MISKFCFVLLCLFQLLICRHQAFFSLIILTYFCANKYSNHSGFQFISPSVLTGFLYIVFGHQCHCLSLSLFQAQLLCLGSFSAWRFGGTV